MVGLPIRQPQTRLTPGGIRRCIDLWLGTVPKDALYNLKVKHIGKFGTFVQTSQLNRYNKIRNNTLKIYSYIHCRRRYIQVPYSSSGTPKQNLAIHRKHLFVFNNLIKANLRLKDRTCQIKVFNLLKCILKSIPIHLRFSFEYIRTLGKLSPTPYSVFEQCPKTGPP